MGNTSLYLSASGSATNFGLASDCFGDSANGVGVGFGTTLPYCADAPRNGGGNTTKINNKLTTAQTAIPVFISLPSVFSVAGRMPYAANLSASANADLPSLPRPSG